MTGKKKRSRWDDEGDEEESSRSSLSKVGKVKQEKGESGRWRCCATGASLSVSQPFKWGDKIKVEEAEGVSAKSPSSNGQAGDDYGKEGREEAGGEGEGQFRMTGALAKDEKTGISEMAW